MAKVSESGLNLSSDLVSLVQVYDQHQIKKEPEDLTQQRSSGNNGNGNNSSGNNSSSSSSHCQSSDRIMRNDKVHSSVISRALANGELANGNNNNNNITNLEPLSTHATSIHLESEQSTSSSSVVVHIRRPNDSVATDPGSLSSALLVSANNSLELVRADMQQQQQQQVIQHYSSAAETFAPTTITTIQSVHGYDSPGAYAVMSPSGQTRYTTINQAAIRQSNSGVYSVASAGASSNTDYYRDYFASNDQYQRPVTHLSYDNHETSSFGDRCNVRQASVYKQQGSGLIVDLPSPDSGIGTDAITPREQSVVQQVSRFNCHCIRSRVLMPSFFFVFFCFSLSQNMRH